MTTNSSIYGPVDSWRLGKSLGVDLLCVDSICSFECVYCQLGKIHRVTTGRRVFVATAKILEDLKKSDWRAADVVTFSGSGEPTLAENLGEAIALVRKFTGKPAIVLTNSTLLHQSPVRAEIALADRVFCKLDAWSEEGLQKADRPASGITLEKIVAGIRLLRADYAKFLAIQTMILHPPSDVALTDFAKILRSIKPDEVQLNTPSRPIPKDYSIATRGNETAWREHETRRLKTVAKEKLVEIGRKLADLTNLPIVTR